MLPLHHSHHEVGGHAAKPRDLLNGIASDALEKSGDDRTRTGDLSPDKRVLSPLSYAPKTAA